MRWQAIVLAGLVACQISVSADEPAQDPRVQFLPEPTTLADFELTGQDGRSFRLSDLRGREALVFFGFTHCPSICPAAMLQMRFVTEALEASGRTAPVAVFISVDGERDTPEVVKKFLGNLPSSFIGLTGDPKSVRKIAAEFKAVFFKGLPYDNAGNYQVEHTSFIYFVNRDGRLEASFLNAPVESMVASISRSRTQSP